MSTSLSAPCGLSPPSGQAWSALTTIGAGGAYYRAGRYVVLYDGEGTLQLEGDAASPPVSSAPGRIVIDVKPSTTGLYVRIVASNPANPLVRIRIVPAAAEATHNTTQGLFNPDFLELVKGVPLLRFASWMRANGNTGSSRTAPRDWAARTTPDHSSQVREADGVAVEHMVALANLVNASMWVSLPRAANESDSYAYGMVYYIATNLAPSLRLTVEYSTDGPGWITSHQAANTQLLGTVARQAWADAGRPRGALRLVMTSPIINAVPHILYWSGLQPPGNASSWLDAVALPGSFGGWSYFTWTRDNPTYWGDPWYLARDAYPRPDNLTVEYVLKLIRQYHAVRSRGLAVLAYAGGPEMTGPLYGARSNFDRVLGSCSSPTQAWPCTFTNIYPPWLLNSTTVLSSASWPDMASRNVTLYGPLAANASREAALESVVRAARLHDSVYGMMLDSLWRWREQLGGDDFVLDITRLAGSCQQAPGARSVIYAPDECRGAANVTAWPYESPSYRALRTWLAGRGDVLYASTGVSACAANLTSLPCSSKDAPPAVPPPKPCSPACVYGTCAYDGSCVCWAGASGADCSVLRNASTPSACTPRLGINLEGIADWSRSWTFVDVFKASREWIPQMIEGATSWSTGFNISLITARDGPFGPTAQGYPAALGINQRAATLCIRDLQGHAPAGIYTVLYDGKGSLDFSMDIQDVQWVEAGHIRLNVTPSTQGNNGILVQIERTDPRDPIRNIRVIMPGFERAHAAGQPFHPAFLSFLRPYGALRFMDWMQTNLDALPVSWADRPTPNDRSYAVSRGGVAAEVMVQLANTLGADPWFNIPHAASDEYIAAFAEFVRDRLRPDVKVYVEYSNEVWHTGFPGGKYAQAQGLLLNTTEQGAAWYGGVNNEARLCFVALKTANISKIWKAAWGAQASRVTVVIAGQSVWPITSSKLLSCRNVTSHIDALAIAPYFGSYVKSRDTNLTVFMDSTLPSQINTSLADVAQHAAIAAQYGKPLLTYESGQSLTGDGSSSDMAIQANRHPGMKDVYTAYLNGLLAKNVSRIMHFSSIGAYSKYGSWGLMEWQDADPRDAPKLQAVQSFMNATATCVVASSAASSCPGNCSSNGVCLADGTCACYDGFTGPDCGTQAYTEVYNCGYRCTFDQGWCNVSSITRNIRTWSCTCKPGITGLTCGIVACPNNCSWNGECLDQGVCACFPGFSGPDCSRDCGCGGHGSCGADGACVCDVGWKRGAGGKCEWDCSGCEAGTSCIGPGECGCPQRCVYGDCFHGACRCWAGYGGPACNVSADDPAAPAGTAFVPRPNRGSLVGVNAGGLAYWSTEWTWVDVMKGSSRWMTANAADTALENPWDTGVALDLRPDGYPARLPPGTVAHKLLIRNVLLHVWPGRYVVLYDGDGRLDFGFDAKVLSRAKGRMEVLLRPTADLACAATYVAYCGDNGMHLVLTATNPANPLRNIRILPSGAGASASAGGAGAGGVWEGRASRAPFHPWYLRSLSRYRTIRFMPWAGTNTNTSLGAPTTSVGPEPPLPADGSAAWAVRTVPASDTQASGRGGGAALEHMVQLCNLLGADPWVNVHHLADDAYVAALAALLRDSLRPDVEVWVEHSNEVWNGLFAQNAYAKARGLALNLSADPNTAAYRYHALRTRAIGRIFRDAFATAPGGGSARVKLVLGGWGFLCSNGQGCGATVMRETLGWNGTAAQVDYYGITGYWDCGLGANGPAEALLSVEEMVAKCEASLNATEAAARALVNASLPYGVPLVTYEAGPSIVESSAIQYNRATDALTPKLVALNRHPAMARLYGAYLDAFRRAGVLGEGRPWMQFVSTALAGKYGSWGMQEYTGQPLSDAPKYAGLQSWLDAAQPASRRPACLDLAAQGGAAAGVAGSAGGGVALAEGLLLGPPAVELPAAGMVLIQGRTYTARWATVGWPDGPSRPLNVTLWAGADCSTDRQQLPAGQALLVLAANAALSPANGLSWRVPTGAESPALAAAVAAAGSASDGRRLPRFFLRITDGLSANYSEPFDIQPPFTYVAGPWSACNCASPASPQQTRSLTCVNTTTAGSAPPDLSPPVTGPFCATYPGWNTSIPSPGDPTCIIDTVTGCRTYRTDRTNWAWSNNKPHAGATKSKATKSKATVAAAAQSAAAISTAAGAAVA
ncbi:hypothetical protein GPECTOR_53g111 [Gonium pectorale]|uniref:EGF-like domain-containing protein n=1 Tax=Gonium pectorale TaxID=33097 RepID=A0A150G7K1_GONPE|nr:hypothetical protein GPECTOR_53g111 [Gonium pectorale]|eukprot:KXZ45525.1 hypothetical protein GPECTOR_53g111 [Gonium pectorale]